MRDLRKKILLESGKTVSKKARSRPESGRGSANHSPVSSSAPSRGASRVNSRYASEEEDGSDSEYDDSLESSIVNSEDGDPEAAPAAWNERLQDRIAELLDRKRSSAKGRETTLNAFAHLIRYHFADEQLENQLNELVPALLKSIRGGSNHEEIIAALKALTTALPISCDTSMTPANTSGSMSCHWSISARGTTSVCPCVIGAMVRNATISSSS